MKFTKTLKSVGRDLLFLNGILGLCCGSLVWAQTGGYYGSVNFDYSGTLSGSFQASLTEPPDTLALPASAAGALILENQDTVQVLIPAYTRVAETTYDAYIIYLRSDSALTTSQSWDISGSLTDFSALMAFMPGIDSAFVAGIVALVMDTSNGAGSVDSLMQVILTAMAAETFFAVNGTINLDTVSADTLGGSFQGTLVKAVFPPQTILVTNGRIRLQGFDATPISITDRGYHPDWIRLYPGHPNPFNSQTLIRYYIPRPLTVELDIFDISGRHVARLESGYRKAGLHSLTWQATRLASGIYFLVLRTGDAVQTQKVILLK